MIYIFEYHLHKILQAWGLAQVARGADLKIDSADAS